MRLKSFNLLIGLSIIFFCPHLVGEDKIDIWDNKKEISKESPSNNNLNKIFIIELPKLDCLLYLSCILYDLI